MSEFNLPKLIQDVFSPEADEIVTILSDVPHGDLTDNGAWVERREMAAEWHEVFAELGKVTGFTVHSLLTYAATGAPHAPLPAKGRMGGEAVNIAEVVLGSTLAIGFSEFSATGPLLAMTNQKEDLRIASLPMVERRMEQTALAADYPDLLYRAETLAFLLTSAIGATLSFDTGHTVYFDLRHRTGFADGGYLHRDKAPPRFINLPSGEAYSVPYEGEVEGEPSQTAGVIPVDYDGERVLFHVEENRIQGVEGDGPNAARMRGFFAQDPARANIAELGLGVNPQAVVTGNVLEDEKAVGVHWAYGRSDALGGTVGPGHFKSPQHVVHIDVVYAANSPIRATTLILHNPDGSTNVIYDGDWTIF